MKPRNKSLSEMLDWMQDDAGAHAPISNKRLVVGALTVLALFYVLLTAALVLA